MHSRAARSIPPAAARPSEPRNSHIQALSPSLKKSYTQLKQQEMEDRGVVSAADGGGIPTAGSLWVPVAGAGGVQDPVELGDPDGPVEAVAEHVAEAGLIGTDERSDITMLDVERRRR